MREQTFLDGRVRLIEGDCLEVLPTLSPVDAVVTDPPYHLTAGKRGGSGPASLNLDNPAGRSRITTGFMGKAWDGGDIAFRPETWALIGNALKPGGYLLAFGAPRNYHRLACAIEDAGFEVRDCLMWIFGQGFPKAKSCLKPAYEPIILAKKRGELKALNIDGCRVGTAVETWPKSRNYGGGQKQPGGKGLTVATPPMPSGRWPANIVHDGSEEVLAGFPETGPPCGSPKKTETRGKVFASMRPQPGSNAAYVGDSGSAARFFYTAKASAKDRIGSKHPTVKPLALMRWLCRLVTPPGGTILDPFAGTGTTGQAALDEGFRAILIEREAEYVADINRRLTHAEPLLALA